MGNEMFNDIITQGINLMVSENYEEATNKFMEALLIDSSNKDAYVHLGNAYANLEDYENALKNFQKVLILDPNDGEAYYSLGSVYLLMDDKLKAVELYNKAESLGFTSSEMYQTMAAIFLDAEDINQALRCINRAIKVNPLNGELRLFKIRLYLAENHFEEALDSLEEMYEILPDAYEAYDLRAQIYSSKEMYIEALDCIKEGRERFPEDMNLAVSELKVLVKANKNEEARNVIKQIKESGNESYAIIKEVAVQEATLDINEKKLQKACDDLLETNTKLGNDADIIFLALDLLGILQDYEKILTYSEILTSMDCGDFYMATALYFHAEALEKTGDVEKAKEEYKRLTSVLRKYTIKNHGFYEGYLYRLMCHTKIGEYEKALELADYVANLYPERADSHAFRYFIYKEKGNMVLAEAEKKIAQSMNSNFNFE